MKGHVKVIEHLTCQLLNTTVFNCVIVFILGDTA